MRTSRLLPLGALLLGVACSGTTNPNTPGTNEVWAQNSAFTPATKTVEVGTTVTFTNKDGITHTVTSSSVPGGASSFNSNLAPNGTTQVTFSVVGTYQYYCTIHGSPGAGMHGTIVAVVF